LKVGLHAASSAAAASTREAQAAREAEEVEELDLGGMGERLSARPYRAGTLRGWARGGAVAASTIGQAELN
jgi:hypothetical protein